MAKKTFSKTDEKRKAEYPSDYGSHASMIDEEATKALKDRTKVVLRDDQGTYITERKRLDSGLADPNRYSGRKEKNED